MKVHRLRGTKTIALLNSTIDYWNFFVVFRGWSGGDYYSNVKIYQSLYLFRLELPVHEITNLPSVFSVLFIVKVVYLRLCVGDL